MRHTPVTLKGAATLCIILGALAGSFSLKSVNRTPLDNATGNAGGIVLLTGVLLLSISLIATAIRRRRQALAARPGFEVTPPRGPAQPTPHDLPTTP